MFAVADANLNTLIDYRYARRHEARRGENGRGSDQYGAAAEDIVLRMPVGTIISDAETGERIVELLEPGEKVRLAKGGDGGFGNLHFKSSTNRAPSQKTPGWPGEQRKLKLELRVLADAGINIQEVQQVPTRKPDRAVLMTTLLIQSISQLSTIIDKLNRLPDVIEARREQSGVTPSA